MPVVVKRELRRREAAFKVTKRDCIPYCGGGYQVATLTPVGEDPWIGNEELVTMGAVNVCYTSLP